MEISYITKREHLGEIEGLQENISPQPPGERAVFPSNFILNKWHSVDCYKIQPYIHQFSNGQEREVAPSPRRVQEEVSRSETDT